MAWTDPTMTSNFAPSPYIVSASSEYNASYAAWKAMDGVTSAGNYWNSNGASPVGEWWKIYMGFGGTPVLLTQLTIQNLVTYGYHDFKLQGSNDNSVWRDIYTGHCDDNSNVQTYSSLNCLQYYMAFRVLCVTGYHATLLVVTEFTMTGETMGRRGNYIHARRDRMNTKGVSTQNQLA